MIMLTILAWGKDIVMKPMESVQAIYDLRNRLGLEDTEYIIWDSAFLCPLKFDRAVRVLGEEEQLEWLMTEVFPQLEEEGRVVYERGKYRRVMPVAPRAPTCQSR